MVPESNRLEERANLLLEDLKMTTDTDLENCSLYLHSGRVVGLRHDPLPSLTEILDSLGRLTPLGGQGDRRYTLLHRSVVVGLLCGRKGSLPFVRGILSQWSQILWPDPHATMPLPDSVVKFRERADRRLLMALSNAWGGLDWRALLRERISTELDSTRQAEARVVLGVDDLVLHRYFGAIPQPPADLVDDAERLIVSSMRIAPQDLAPLTFTLLDALIESGSSTGPFVDQSIHAYGRRIFDAAAT